MPWTGCRTGLTAPKAVEDLLGHAGSGALRLGCRARPRVRPRQGMCWACRLPAICFEGPRGLNRPQRRAEKKERSNTSQRCARPGWEPRSRCLPTELRAPSVKP
ncbi:hypothetical protein NDU88_001807 [Pleurodeles waltl]|uniref:Uncharacterized protein n=1 Tax=Pleurodeles waltl TaxID=8319 RepID=A0AAV7M0N8_PLEWA|nr:hypothetical protein NDU88_001807 [Pleurodeles waltl]